MEFYIPTRIYHEDGAVLNHGSEIASLGRKALIVTGRSSAVKTGALDDVIKALGDNDTEYVLYDKIEEPGGGFCYRDRGRLTYGCC